MPGRRLLKRSRKKFPAAIEASVDRSLPGSQDRSLHVAHNHTRRVAPARGDRTRGAMLMAIAQIALMPSGTSARAGAIDAPAG